MKKTVKKKKIADGVELFNKFHNEPVDKVFTVKGKIPDLSVAVVVGHVESIQYGAKSARVGRRKHDFHPKNPSKRPLLCVTPDGKTAFLIGGQWKFNKKGFIDIN